MELPHTRRFSKEKLIRKEFPMPQVLNCFPADCVYAKYKSIRKLEQQKKEKSARV